MIHSELIFTYGVKKRSNFIILHVNIVVPALFVEEAILSPLKSTGTVENQLAIM